MLILLAVLACSNPSATAAPPSIEAARQQAAADNWRRCETVEDCVTVGCTCSCSGCGGFDADDVVHKDHVAAWYAAAGCKAAEICPEVCCPPSELKCESGQCTVTSGVPLAPHVLE